MYTCVCVCVCVCGQVFTSDPIVLLQEDQIQIAVAQLRSMGYEDEGGWLTELVKAKKGNVERVLEALHPSQ